MATTRENLQAAESRIRDVDMAEEMMEYTKNNILLAGCSGDARAGQRPAAGHPPAAPVIAPPQKRKFNFAGADNIPQNTAPAMFPFILSVPAGPSDFATWQIGTESSVQRDIT
jgi:hypothetical protein